MLTEPSEAIARKFKVILAISTTNEPTLDDIARVTQLPRSSIKRIIAKLRSDYTMDIRFEPYLSEKGRTGYYRIHNWGVFNRNEVMVKFGYLLSNQDSLMRESY